jgi:hypothetical protein
MKIPWSQILPPAPSFTAHSIPDLAGKIFIVTGGSSGIGFALSSLLYAHNGTVYIATRSETKALAAISAIETGNPDARGRLEYLHLDLADLAGVKGCVDGFLGREMRLDALWCNAGVFVPPVGSRSAQVCKMRIHFIFALVSISRWFSGPWSLQSLLSYPILCLCGSRSILSLRLVPKSANPRAPLGDGLDFNHEFNSRYIYIKKWHF